jgi:hypothetical protein
MCQFFQFSEQPLTDNGSLHKQPGNTCKRWKFECGSHPYSHVCRVSHNACAMGQDPPLCFLSSDRGYVLVFILPVTTPHADHQVSLQQMVLFGQNPSQGTLLRASQFLAGRNIEEIVFFSQSFYHHLRGAARSSCPSCEGT